MRLRGRRERERQALLNDIRRVGTDFHLRWDDLATYNAEVARGIVHTAKWDERMRLKQERYDREVLEGRAMSDQSGLSEDFKVKFSYESMAGRSLGAHIDLRASFGRGDGGENVAHHRRNLKDPGSCRVPKDGTITLAEWKNQQVIGL